MAGPIVGTKAANEGGVNQQNYDAEGKFARKFSSSMDFLIGSSQGNAYLDYIAAKGSVFNMDSSKPKRPSFPDLNSFMEAFKKYNTEKAEFLDAVNSSDIGDEAIGIQNSSTTVDDLIQEADTWERKFDMTTDPKQGIKNMIGLCTPELVSDVLSKQKPLGNTYDWTTMGHNSFVLADRLAEELYGTKRVNLITKEELEALNPVKKVVGSIADIQGEDYHEVYRGLSGIKSGEIEKTIEGYFVDDENHSRSIYGGGMLGRCVYLTSDYQRASDSYGDSMVIRGVVNLRDAKIMSYDDFCDVRNKLAQEIVADRDNIKSSLIANGISDEDAEKFLELNLPNDRYRLTNDCNTGLLAVILGIDGIIEDGQSQISMYNPRMVSIVNDIYFEEGGYKYNG